MAWIVRFLAPIRIIEGELVWLRTLVATVLEPHPPRKLHKDTVNVNRSPTRKLFKPIKGDCTNWRYMALISLLVFV